MSQPTLPVSPPPPPARTPRIAALPGMTDSHFHVFGPTDAYPLHPARGFDPPFAPVEDYLAMARTIGIARMVAVQGGVYGTDNSCLLDALAKLGPERARGIAVIDQSATAEDIARMHESGVRGIRFNAITGNTPVDWLPALATLIAPFGWHIQLWIGSARLPEVADILTNLPVPVVLDHMGQFPIQDGVAGPQFQNVLRLLENDHVWIKLIGYRVSNAPETFADILEPVKAILDTAPERCLWGSDWPHIFLQGRPMPNTTDLFEAASAWVSPSEAQRVFVDNPARLYGFA